MIYTQAFAEDRATDTLSFLWQHIGLSPPHKAAHHARHSASKTAEKIEDYLATRHERGEEVQKASGLHQGEESCEDVTLGDECCPKHAH
mmetsp:Transcript_114513/g.186681  ORF Transcript_114513/g.186681 Transcript_114513/m.186681 type:complete len:89 (+) Transcript_114513:3-269(+)